MHLYKYQLLSQPDIHFLKIYIPFVPPNSCHPLLQHCISRGTKLSYGLTLRILGHCSLCPTAVLDPEWHHKGQHPFWVGVG